LRRPKLSAVKKKVQRLEEKEDTTCHSKCNFSVIWIFAVNFGDLRYEHSERLHQDIYNMKTLPRELELSNACQLLLATSERLHT
jgi:hypothetical protein